ncbi:MAG: cytochrome c biogenesis protein ResB [Bacteroidales bacterium]|jgi:hypothetical protein
MDKEGKGRQKAIITELTIVFAVIIAGAALQMTAGPFDPAIVRFPANVVFLFIFLATSALAPNSVIARFGTLSLSVILISLLLTLSLIMGLIPQSGITTSWPFALTYLMLLTNLALVVGRRARCLRLKDAGFMLNHAGLFILLFSGGFGSADSGKYFMTVYEGKIEWRGENTKTGQIDELPVAILLKNFEMEEYFPKTIIIDKKSGDAIPSGDWVIVSDSLVDNHNHAPAAYISASNSKTGDKYEGWVSCGNYSQPFRVLDLTEGICVAMAYPEPKSFSSEIEVKRESGSSKSGVVQVNHPLTVGSWKIYQYSYDMQKGRDSAYSVFQLVHDPWLIPAYIGIFMLFIGSVTLFWKGGKR